jgi:hypothetical protein
VRAGLPGVQAGGHPLSRTEVVPAGWHQNDLPGRVLAGVPGTTKAMITVALDGPAGRAPA